MKSLKQNYEINGKIEKVWQALVNPEIIAKWGGGPAEMSGTQGFKFKLWAGDVYGENIKVIPTKKLKQEWYGGKWESPSFVTFKLSEKGGKTKVELIHTNIPDNEFENIKSGWKEYYMLPLKKVVEEEN